MKRVAVLLTAFAVLAAALLIVSFRFLTPAPEKVLVKMLKALQKGSITKAEKYTATGLGLEVTSSRVKKLYKAMYNDMRFTVADTVIGGETAQITVSVTMVDVETLLAKTSRELLDMSLGGRRGEKKYYKLLTTRIKSGREESATYVATVHLVRKKDGWKIDIEKSKNFLLAITGGAGPLTS